MGTIIERPRKNGSIAYLAQILVMRESKIVHRESRTFDRRPAAKAWMTKREAELVKPGATLGSTKRQSAATLADAIDKYVAASTRAMGRTKTQVLRSIKSYDLAAMPCAEITSDEYLNFAQEVAATGAKPQTVETYLSHLGAVVNIARAAWKIPLDPQALVDGRKVAKALGVTSKGGKRSRRPTLDELDKLLSYFTDRKNRLPDSAPMAALIVFAIFSTRRQEEITRITWADLETQHSRVMVRDMKNPGEKIGNDVFVDLPPEALRTIQAQPGRDGAIFPFNPKSCGSAFTRACKFLDIEDLHFHDLRHDGISRLFEMDWTIPHVAAVSGHRTWESLKRYTHLRQTGDKYAGWKWLDRVAPKDGEASQT